MNKFLNLELKLDVYPTPVVYGGVVDYGPVLYYGNGMPYSAGGVIEIDNNIGYCGDGVAIGYSGGDCGGFAVGYDGGGYGDCGGDYWD